MKKLVLLMLVIGMLVLQVGMVSAQEDEFTVAFVPGQITEPFYISAKYGAEDIAEEYIY
ncbi:MAG: hypothetical protein U5K53_09540 [Halanaerobiales bacterium]|nr:hypothetical protein [Halanaerobiales bacterium]